MHQKVIALEKIDGRRLLQTVALSFVIVFVPYFVHNQIITGTIVNAVLIFSLLSFGFRQALVLCFVPGFLAFASGLLATAAYPILPFIMLSNVLLIAVFYFLFDSCGTFWNYWKTLFVAAFLKFVFLYSASIFVTYLSTGSSYFIAFLSPFSFPQLATALSGGALAYFFLSNNAKNK
jgi:hypothetical protein